MAGKYMYMLNMYMLNILLKLYIQKFIFLILGKKLPLLVIGKSKNLYAFKRVKQLPVKYRANKKAWMTADLFTEWIRNVGQNQMRRQKCQILMVVDNCPTHPNINDLENVKLVFLPQIPL